ncbi:MAG: hypothetical protein JXR41_12720 [Bacteroidales bacterium]|nr:hypothetical protein [Bacteroidales bacterium]MBN2763950.1 hypothetical protein [Bacteroidales bacterium]
MKRIILILFSFFYLVALTGFPLTVHYCHGSIESVQVFSPEKECCCDYNEMSENCCRNVHYWLKAGTDEQLSSPSLYPPVCYAMLAMDWQLNDYNISSETKLSETLFYDIPPPQPAPKWLMNCSLTLYG